MKKLNLKQVIQKRIVRGRTPWSIASDIVFFALILMFIFPTTRRTLYAGVAYVRTIITSTGSSDNDLNPLEAEGWSWNLTDGQGSVSTFGSLKGELIFLNQWATWCPPCRAELNSIEKLYKAYGTRVKFVMLTSENSDKVKNFMDKEGYTFPVSYGTVAGPSLTSRSIPATTIINRNGGIVVSKKGAFNWYARKIRRTLDSQL
jgi:thiol-disulfide isomerase/thioredoxin